MSDAAREARTLLWEWLGEADDPDAQQRAWKLARLGGMLDACERAGLLPAEEMRAWRGLAAGEAPASPPALDPAAARGHLEALLAALRPLSRDPEPGTLAASSRLDGALDALRQAGVLDDEEAAAWRTRSFEAKAPWLDRDDLEELAGYEGDGLVFAIGVPARSPEEEAADAAADLELEALMRRGELRRVLTCRAPDRHEGLAILAVVVRAEATEVLFHHVGPPHGEFRGGFADLAAFSALADALSPPELVDDAGTTYEPVSPRPVSSHGSGGMPDPARPRVVTGVWRYAPAAPDTARRFTAALDGARWTFSAREP